MTSINDDIQDKKKEIETELKLLKNGHDIYKPKNRKLLRKAYKHIGPRRIAEITGVNLNTLKNNKRKEFNLPYYMKNRAKRLDGKTCRLLDNPAELYDLLWNKNLTIKAIAKKLEVDWNTVNSAFKKHRIPTKTLEQSRKVTNETSIPLTYALLLFLIGSLLGDGYIRGRKYVASYTLVQSFDRKEYIDFVASLFKEAGYKVTIRLKNTLAPNGKPVNAWTLTTNGSMELLKLWKQWYRKATPEERKNRPDIKWVKVVPNNLVLHPFSLLIWHLEDGSIYRHKKNWGKSKTIDKQVINMKFCTQGFPMTSIQKLRQILIEYLALNRNEVYINKSGNIRINKSPMLSLLHIMPSNPFKCFSHKFPVQ